jgi:hypothetical protein
MTPHTSSIPIKDIENVVKTEANRPIALAATAVTNEPFIDDDLGDGHARATREAARFSTMIGTLLASLGAAETPEASFKPFRLVRTSDIVDSDGHRTERWNGGYDLVQLDEVAGPLVFKPTRPSKHVSVDLNNPSRQLRDFLHGEGVAYEKYRDEVIAQLLRAWANHTRPEGLAMRTASEAVSRAVAARAGLSIPAGQLFGF